MSLVREIQEFLYGNGFSCGLGSVAGVDVIFVGDVAIVPFEIRALGVDVPEPFGELFGTRKVMMVAEDRWRSQGEMYRARILAHLGRFRSIFARKCSVRKIDKAMADTFLDKNHTYGRAACRYCYGLFDGETLAGVAAFSNSRKWDKGGKFIRSYEWVRYASEPGTRIVGGMGRALAAFIEDVHPDDVMSYADLEWSDGEAYRRLGFVAEGRKEAVLFAVDPVTWRRRAISPDEAAALPQGTLFYRNRGSIKYRLKLTDY